MRYWLLVLCLASIAAAEPYPRVRRERVHYNRVHTPQAANGYEPAAYPQVEPVRSRPSWRSGPAGAPRRAVSIGTEAHVPVGAVRSAGPGSGRPASGFTLRPAAGRNWVISTAHPLTPGSLLSLWRQGEQVGTARVLQCGSGVALTQLASDSLVLAGDQVVIEQLAPAPPEPPAAVNTANLPTSRDPRYQEWLRRNDASFSPGRIYGTGFIGGGFGFRSYGYRRSWSRSPRPAVPQCRPGGPAPLAPVRAGAGGLGAVAVPRRGK